MRPEKEHHMLWSSGTWMCGRWQCSDQGPSEHTRSPDEQREKGKPESVSSYLVLCLLLPVHVHVCLARRGCTSKA